MPQFDNNMFSNPQMGSQGGGMMNRQMGGGMPQIGGPPGPQMPQPRPAGGQAAPGSGGQMGIGSMPFAQQQAFGQRGIGGGGQREKLQGNIDHYQNQLMMAQMQGAPPQIIAQLQQALQQAQRAYQEAGIMAAGNRNMNAPQPTRGVGTSSGTASNQEQMRQYDAMTQMLMALWGMGGGHGPQMG